MPLNPATIAIIIGLVAIGIFGAGFAVADWKASGELEKIRAESQLLKSANSKCALDIAEVSKAAQSVMDVAIEREKQAEKAIQQIQPQIERKKARIYQIRQLPVIPESQQCAAIESEQIAYVKVRQEEAQ